MVAATQQELTWANIRVDAIGKYGIKFENDWYGLNKPYSPQQFVMGQVYQVGVRFSAKGKPFIVSAPAISNGGATQVTPSVTPAVIATPPPVAAPAPAVVVTPAVVTQPVVVAPPMIPQTVVTNTPAPGGIPPIAPPVQTFAGNNGKPTREGSILFAVCLKIAGEYVARRITLYVNASEATTAILDMAIDMYNVSKTHTGV